MSDLINSPRKEHEEPPHIEILHDEDSYYSLPDPNRYNGKKGKFFVYKDKASNHWESYRFWRGLEREEWDVHTVASCRNSIIDGVEGGDLGKRGGKQRVNHAAGMIDDDGYKLHADSTCRCLNGKCGGFFETFNAPVFLTSSLICISFIILFAVAPELAYDIFPAMKAWVSTYVGWIYIITVDIILVLLFVICLTRYGEIRLGDDDSTPDFSYFSWATMLFSAGMGIGLVFYGVAEPLTSFTSPPHVIYGESRELAFERAIPLTIFNWGFHAWATYSILGLAICYFSARLKLPLSIRSALYPILGKWTLRWPGHVVDIIAVMGTLFGLSTSLGLGTIQLNAGINYMNPDIPVGFSTQAVIVVVVTAIAMCSVLSGTSKGMKWLSNINTILSFVLWVSVFFIGRPAPQDCLGLNPLPRKCAAIVEPFGSVLQNFEGIVQNFGLYFQILAERFFRTGAYSATEKQWMSDWTIYYLGWFISWSPFVSTFLAEISRGRTMKQYIIGTLFLPLAVTVFWFTVFGLFGMNAEPDWYNTLPYPGVDGTGNTLHLSETDWNVLHKQPVEVLLFALYGWAGEIELIAPATVSYLSVLTLIVLVIFFVSSSDSGCFVITILASGGSRTPPTWQKVFWVWVTALIALVLLSNGDAQVALESLQALVIAMGLPLCVILLLIVAGMIKTMSLDPYIVHAPKPIYPDDLNDINARFNNMLNVQRQRSHAVEQNHQRKASIANLYGDTGRIESKRVLGGKKKKHGGGTGGNLLEVGPQESPMITDVDMNRGRRSSDDIIEYVSSGSETGLWHDNQRLLSA